MRSEARRMVSDYVMIEQNYFRQQLNSEKLRKRLFYDAQILEWK